MPAAPWRCASKSASCMIAGACPSPLCPRGESVTFAIIASIVLAAQRADSPLTVPILQHLPKRGFQRFQLGFDGFPLVEAVTVDRSTDLLGAGRPHRSRVFVERQAGRIERQAEIIEQSANFPFRIVDQVFVDDAM